MDAGGVGSADDGGPDGVVDQALLEGLSTDVGAHEVQALCDLFVSDASTRVEALRAGVDAGNTDAAARTAHCLKSAAGSVGAIAFAARCATIERLACGGELDAVRAEVGTLPDDLSKTAAALARVVRCLLEVAAWP